MYDIAIIGAGPAGITAGIYAARKRLKVLLLTKDIGGQAAYSADIENYTGFQFITGVELAKKFEEHIRHFENIDFHLNEEVTCIRHNKDGFDLETAKQNYAAKTVVLAPGRKPKALGVPGEPEFKNRGVTYCATCDGPLFAGKRVAIVGGGNSALDAALQMRNIASKVYIITMNDRLFGDEVMIEKVLAAENIEIFYSSLVSEIKGSDFVESLSFKQDGRPKEIAVSGVMVEIGSDPVNAPACHALKTNRYGEILVNERCETNVPGMFAAGDVTNVPYKQIIIAAGHGCIASLSAFEFISKRR